MNVVLTFVIVSIAVFTILIALKSRSQKRHNSITALISSSAIVETPLTPKGSVLIAGELWLARSVDGTFIPSKATVTVVGIRGHLLLVALPQQSQNASMYLLRNSSLS